jgi:hypothetical protein
MARKLILVDEEMYKALITKQPSDLKNDENINFNLLKSNLKKSLNRRQKNLSTKKVNYQQDLRRYLKARKEIKDRPMKVKLENGANLLAKPSTDDKSVDAILIDSTGDLDDTAIYSEHDGNRSRRDSIHSSNRSRRDSLHSSNRSRRDSIASVESNYKTPESSGKTAKDYPANLLNKPEGKSLYDYLMADPDKFGLTKDGKVMRGRTLVKSSNIGEIIEHLIKSNTIGSASPPGTNAIRSKLANDEFYKNLRETIRTGQTPRRSVFNPKRW